VLVCAENGPKERKYPVHMKNKELPPKAVKSSEQTATQNLRNGENQAIMPEDGLAEKPVEKESR